MSKLKQSDLPENMHLKPAFDPMKDPLVAEHMNPTTCPIHRYKMSTATDGTKFCPKCSMEAAKAAQLDRIRTDSAKVAREGTAPAVKRFGR